MKKIVQKHFIIILILLSLVSGIVWAFTFGNNPGSSDDARSYDEFAQTLVSDGFKTDQWVENQLFDRPLYPIFLAGVYSVFGHNFDVLRIIQILMFVGIGVLIYFTCRFFISEKMSRFVSILWALAYSPAAYAGIFYREIFFTLLIVVMLYFLYKAQHKSSLLYFSLSGLFLGLALLTNSVLQFLIILLAINLFFVLKKKNTVFKIKSLLCFIIPFIIIVGSWAIFCQSNFKTVPAGGAGLFLAERVETMHSIDDKYIEHLIGNGIGDYLALKFYPEYNSKLSRHGWEAWAKYDELVAQGVSFKTIDEVFTQPSLKDIVNHPIMFLKMETIDFLKFNQPMTPVVWMQAMFVGTHPGIADWAKISIILIIRLIYLLFSFLIIYAILKTLKRWSKVSWLIIIIIYFNFVYSTLHATARYSIPIYPLYIIFLALGIMFWINKIRHKDENLFNN
jgi:4-amino-4-deoxy-L-arabinose transferase-like glycosyltransferase